jgi:DNA-binding NarL/FixJ family response regulator
MLVRAAEASWWSGRQPWADEASRLAAEIPTGTDERQAQTVALLVGSAMVLRDEFEEGAGQLARVPHPSQLPADPRLLVSAAAAAVFRGDDAAAHLGYSRAAEVLRARGAIGELPYVLGLTAAMELNQGRLGAAAANAAESLRLSCETHQETDRCYVLSLTATIHAIRGEEECRTRAAEALESATAREAGTAAAHAIWALARLELGLGHPVEALAHLARIGEPGRALPSSLLSLISTPDLVEAAVRTGKAELVEGPLRRYERWASSVHSVSALAIVARLRALLACGAEADALFEEAIAGQEQLRHPFDLARTRLLHGEHLRRSRRRLAAREELRAALAAFETLGAAGWAERARTELRASGETSRRPASFRASELTPQELQIARFVSEGASNRDVAAQLFVSRRTVEHHLSKVFAKLGITSRGELARALADMGEEGAPAV